MGFLDGGAQRLFGELLTQLYMSAKLTDRTASYDNEGTLQMGSAPRDCRAKVDSATERMRQAEGYTDTDRAIYILAASLTGEVTTDCEVQILQGPYAGKTFGIASHDRPPGASYWLCRGTARG
jgi:hypothetical protein